jgi:hypothetical protein
MMYEIVHTLEKYALNVISAFSQRNLNTSKVKFFTALFCPATKHMQLPVDKSNAIRPVKAQNYQHMVLCVCQQM